MRIFYTLGWLMCSIGGFILIFLGIAAALNIFLLIVYPFFATSAFLWGVIIGIMGLICLGGARFVRNLPTAILLLLVGIGASLLGAWYAAWLIIIGAIFGMISRA